MRAIRERAGVRSIGGLTLAAPTEGGELSEWSDPEGLLALDEDEIQLEMPA